MLILPNIKSFFRIYSYNAQQALSLKAIIGQKFLDYDKSKPLLPQAFYDDFRSGHGLAAIPAHYSITGVKKHY
jgi:hypothetical protein